MKTVGGKKAFLERRRNFFTTLNVDEGIAAVEKKLGQLYWQAN